MGYFLKRLMLLFMALLFSVSVMGQVRPVRQSAIDAFDRGDFNTAYIQFNDLLASYPKDPVYKFYKGACMVNLEADPHEAVRLLTEAGQTASLSRPLPLESFFYLGRARQQAGLFAEAIVAFNEYSEKAGRKAARDLGVPSFVSQCEAGKGALSGPYRVLTVDDMEDTLASIEEIAVEAGNKQEELFPLKESNVSEEIVATIAPIRELMPADYDALLSEAVLYQKQTDSLSVLIDEQQAGLSGATTRERAAIIAEIGRNRRLADSLQTIADEKFSSAQELINNSRFTGERDSASGQNQIVAGQQPLAKERSLPTTSASAVLEQTLEETPPQKAVETRRPDSTIVSDIQMMPQDTIKLPEETGAAIGNIVAQSVKALPGVTSMFEVDKKLATSREEIIINPELPRGLVYRIQVAILRNPATQSTFKGLSPVYGLREASATSTKYYVGLFRKRADANSALVEVKKAGFTDAFIIALLSGNSISTERAASLEKEWESVPFAYTDVGVRDVVADTVPPVLSYRVVLLRTKQPVKEDQLNMMKRIAGNRGMDIFTMENGEIVYLVGTFVTYESAAEYADLVSRNGFPDAEVAAWLGRREIPLETARQLFDMI